MKRTLLAAIAAIAAVAGLAFAQTALPPPGLIGDSRVNNAYVQETLNVTGTSVLTGAVTAPAGVTGAITGNVTGNVTGNLTGNVTGNITGNSTGTHTGAVAATTLSASSTVSGAGVTALFASPPAVGGTVAAAGSFTTLAASSTLGVTGVTTTTGGIASTVSPRWISTGMAPATASTDGNDSTPSITETYVSEIFVPYNMTLTGVALFNGSDVTGTVTVGLATAAGAPIAGAKSAATAGSGTDAYQRVPFATPYAAVGPAMYYIQVQYSSATARYNTHTIGNFGCLVQTAQTYGALTSFTPPTTFVTNVCNIASLY